MWIDWTLPGKPIKRYEKEDGIMPKFKPRFPPAQPAFGHVTEGPHISCYSPSVCACGCKQCVEIKRQFDNTPRTANEQAQLVIARWKATETD